MPTTEPSTLLVLRALGLGDFLTSLPALRGLAAAFPHHRKLLAAPRPIAPLVQLSDCGYELVHCPDPHTRPLGVPSEVDVAVNLHGKGPESHRLLLQLDPRSLIAFRHDRIQQTTGFPRWRPDTHEVTRWCDLLRRFSIPCDESRLELKAPVSERAHPEITILHPGSASKARRWPPKRWAAVARTERQAGRKVLLTGGPDERALCRFIAAEASLPYTTVLAGDTDLVELAALVAGAGRVVCGDTGIAHLATALHTPSVVLFGPTAPSRWGPPPNDPIHRVIWKGSTGDPHGTVPDAGLLEIDVEEVQQALEQLPQRRPEPAGA